MKSEIILSEAKKIQPLLSTFRRQLHQSPELGLSLPKTKDFVMKQLISMGYKPKEYGRCGLTALVGGKHPGKTFLLRADMDALPITEQTGLPFQSETTGTMHACGHDLHTSMLLGAAKLLKDHEDEIQGTVKLFFQPGEETFEGAKDMIEAGALKDPAPDAAMMLHVTLGMPLKTGGAVICGGGVSAPGADYFEIHIQGKGGHGAMPQLGIDPITIASHIVIALQEIHARELAMAEEAALTIGVMQAGIASNVIPDTAKLCGTLRAYDETVREHLKERLVQISEGIAKTFRGKAEVRFTSGCPTLLNDKSLSADLTGYCQELLGPTSAFSADALAAMASSGAKATGSEDFAYISHEVPSIMIALAAGNASEDCAYPLHHPKTTFNEDALAIGSSIFTYCALRWLEEHKI